jgi:hypothetical protein
MEALMLEMWAKSKLKDDEKGPQWVEMTWMVKKIRKG